MNPWNEKSSILKFHLAALLLKVGISILAARINECIMIEFSNSSQFTS